MLKIIKISLLVGLGGFVGSLSRYGLAVLAQRYSCQWPLGTLASNILGCLFIGIITELSSRGVAISPELRLALATGFCGGFTTLSSMVYETSEMLKTSEYANATLYSGGTFILSMTAFAIGIFLVKLSIKFGGLAWN
jgi:CrcB protein